MLLAPAFLNYERPEGHEPGHPDILVRSKLVDRFGAPEVDYDNFSRLLIDRLGYTPEKLPVTSIYHRLNNYDNPVHPSMLHEGIDRHSYRWGNTLHINADKRLNRFDRADSIDSEYVMRTIALQAAAYSLVKARRITSRKEAVASTALPPVLIGGAAIMGEPALIDLAASSPVLSALWVHHHRRTRLKPAAQAIARELLPDHTGDIVFPSRPRKQPENQGL